MISGITLRFGQWCLAPLTRLMIAMIKHGMKTHKIAPIITMNNANPTIPTNKIPMNAMPVLWISEKPFATKC
jgi:hypothetical protein